MWQGNLPRISAKLITKDKITFQKPFGDTENNYIQTNLFKNCYQYNKQNIAQPLDKDLNEVFKGYKQSNFVIQMVDLSQKTIEDLLYKQIKRMTLQNKDTFNYQFSGAWTKI